MFRLARFFKGKKVLVTGHTGFQGAWLCQIFLRLGADVGAIALAPHTTPNLFTALGLAKSIRHYLADIREYKNLRFIVKKEKPEIVIHLAAQALVRAGYENPLETFSTNVLGTVNLIEAVRGVGSARSIIVSTTDKVYKNTQGHSPYREGDELGGHDPYSASKSAADLAVQAYLSSFSLPVAIVRSGNTIGGGDWGEDRLVPDIVRAVFERHSKVALRNPSHVRPWQYVMDPLYGYLLLAKEIYLGNARVLGAWNFGPDRGNYVSVESLVKQSLRILNLKTEEYSIQSHVDDRYEAKSLVLDASRAKKFLGWRPRCDLQQTLERTLLWYRKYYSEPKSIPSFSNKQIDEFFAL